ncbi:MAG TPA: hypothetical protein VGJ04_06820 [Pirellulales bacterium]|jgi:hypothetical protein
MRPVYIAGLCVALATLLVHVASYSWGPSLTLCDLRVDLDEGLVAVELPLTLLAPKGSLTTKFVLYKRTAQSWAVWPSGADGHCPYRNWMYTYRLGDFMFLDFGYWRGGWQSDSRPGPFLFIFLPVWFVGLSLFGLFLAIRYRLLRFTLRTLLIGIALWSLILWLLTLRSAV